MRHQPHDIVAHLRLDLASERLFLRIGGAGKEEILPDQHAGAVAGLIELVGLEDAAAPDA